MLTATKKYEFEPDFAVPPGETLQEVMESLGMGQKELAVRTGLTVQSLHRIFKGEQPITYETANRLELATGVPARMWNNLEAQYREQLSKVEERRRLEASLEWLKTIPTQELVDRKVIPDEKDKALLLREVLKFYGVSSVDAWRGIWELPAVAARRSHCFETCPGPASVWIRLGELQAQKIECAPYDKKRFQSALQVARSLTVKEPSQFLGELRRLCSEAGVAVALAPEIKKVPWHGATKWLLPHKAMILLSLRYKTDDQFWFSFFHEAGHVLHDGKKDLYINEAGAVDPREIKANEFASEILIPRVREAEVAKLTSRAAAMDLAADLGISPGIVVGRFQRLTGKWDTFNDLKRRLDWGF